MSPATPDLSRTLLCLVHDEQSTLGHFGPVLAERGFEVEVASLVLGPPPRHPVAAYAGVLVLGSGAQVDQEHIHPWITEEKRLLDSVLAAEVPLAGVCFGGQILADVSGGHVGPTEDGRRGWQAVDRFTEARTDPIFGGVGERFTTFVWHLYEFRLPPAATPLAKTPTNLQAFRLTDRPAWGMQFHPEVTPAMMSGWVQWMREQRPELGEAVINGYIEDAGRLVDEQRALATHLGNSFLDQVEQRSTGRSRGRGTDSG